MAGTTDTALTKSAAQNDGGDNRPEVRQEANPAKASVESWQNNNDFNQFQERRNALGTADKSLPVCTLESSKDSAKDGSQCRAAQGEQIAVGEKAKEIAAPKETPEQKEQNRQNALKATLMDAAATPEKRLSAANDLLKAGVTNLKVDDNGVQRQLRLELDKSVPPKDMVHVWAKDERGKERIVLRGKDAGDGKFEQETGKGGRPVSFYGSWWNEKKAGKSVFAEGPVRAAQESARQDRPKQETLRQESPRQESPRSLEPEASLQARPAQETRSRKRSETWSEPQKLGGPMSMARPNESRSAREFRNVSLVPHEFNANDPFNLLPGGSGNFADFGASRDMSREISAGMNQGRKFYQGPGDTVVLNGAGHIDADGGTNWRNDRTGQAHTSLRDARGRSLNAETRNFVAVPKDLYKGMGLKMGDAVLVEYNGRQSWGIIGDAGPNARQKWGEMSVHMAKELGINADPNRGGVQSGVRYTFFKNSHHEKGTNPHSNAEAQTIGMSRLERSYKEARLRRGA